MQPALGTPCDDRTLGFRYKEMHLPLDVDVYVLGVVGENGCIGAPQAGAKDQRFLISVKSEETRAAELGSASKVLLGLGIGSLGAAVICLGAALWLAREGLSLPSFRKTCRMSKPGGDAPDRCRDKAVGHNPRDEYIRSG